MEFAGFQCSRFVKLRRSSQVMLAPSGPMYAKLMFAR